MEGRIVKLVSNFYEVDTSQELVSCKPRGVFKKKGLTPLVGDFVSIEKRQDGQGIIYAIHPRKNELFRPPVANIDQAVLVFSVVEPVLNTILLDRFLVHVEQANILALLCFSKVDLIQKTDDREALRQEVNEVVRCYGKIGYAVVQVSAKTGEGLDNLRTHLRSRTTVFAGQSGVGKSSLFNRLVSGSQAETAEISQKLGRGRHTTRHVELRQLSGRGEEGSFLVDTPGFSQLDFRDLAPEDLPGCFREFRAPSKDCRFRGCLHDKEPGCGVKEKVEAGGIVSFRYEHYLSFLHEVREKEKRKW